MVSQLMLRVYVCLVLQQQLAGGLLMAQFSVVYYVELLQQQRRTVLGIARHSTA